MAISTIEEREALRETLQELFEKECPTELVRELRKVESSGFPEALWKHLASVGVFGLAIPEEWGGSGAGMDELGIVFREAGRALCPTIVYATLVFGLALNRLGREEQKREYFPLLVGGGLRATTSLWDAGDASDVRPELLAESTHQGWLINGELLFVSNAHLADVLLVSALNQSHWGSVDTCAFLIDRDSPGVTVEPVSTMAGDKQTRVIFENCLVPDEHHVANVDSEDLRWIANAAIALQCMEMTGGTETVLERTVEYVKNRIVFGRPIGAFQAAQHHIANMRIALEGCALTTSQAVTLVGDDASATRAVAIAKMTASEAYKFNTLTAHQLHGGIGYTREYDLHLWSDRAKTTEILGGSADVAARWLEEEMGLGTR